MGEIASWASQSIANAIQKLGGAKEEDSVVQILNDVIGRCKKRITTVANQEEDAIRLSVDFVDESDRGAGRNKWLNFCKEVWGWGTQLHA